LSRRGRLRCGGVLGLRSRRRYDRSRTECSQARRDGANRAARWAAIKTRSLDGYVERFQEDMKKGKLVELYNTTHENLISDSLREGPGFRAILLQAGASSVTARAGYTVSLLRRFLEGTRRVSPVA